MEQTAPEVASRDASIAPGTLPAEQAVESDYLLPTKDSESPVQTLRELAHTVDPSLNEQHPSANLRDHQEVQMQQPDESGTGDKQSENFSAAGEQASLKDEKEEQQDKEQIDIEARRQFQMEKLRELAPFFRHLRKHPHLWDRVREKIKYRDTLFGAHMSHSEADDYLSQGEWPDKDEAIKRIVPILSAAATVPEARTILQAIVDKAAQNESDRIRELLAKEGPVKVDILKVGAGIMGATVDAAVLARNPHMTILTVDRDSKLGGQFRSWGGPVFRMNTPNTAVNKDIKGELDNINMNTFGPDAPVQLTQMTGDMFADNEIIGLTAALNEYLCGTTLLDTEVIDTYPNTDPSVQAEHVFEILDHKTNEVHKVYVEGGDLVTGLGESDYGFRDPDQETARVIAERGENLPLDEKQVYTHGELLTYFGIDSLARKRFAGEDIIIIGGGHSAWTDIEQLTGMGPGDSEYVAAMGSVADITILNSPYATKEEFHDKEMARYGAVAELYPDEVTNPDSKESLIHPIMGARAVRMEQVSSRPGQPPLPDDPIRVWYYQKDKDGKPVKDEDGNIKYLYKEGGIVITTTGFKDKTTEVLHNYMNKGQEFILDQKVMLDCLQDIITTPGAEIQYKDGVDTGLKRLEILGVEGDGDQQQIRYREVTVDGKKREGSALRTSELFNSLYTRAESIDCLVRPMGEAGETIQTFCDRDRAQRDIEYYLSMKGSVLEFTDSPLMERIEVKRIEKSGRTTLVTTVITGASGQALEQVLTLEQIEQEVVGNMDKLSRVTMPPARRVEELPYIYSDSNGHEPVGRSLPGRGRSIVLSGAAAKLPTSHTEKMQSMMYGGPTNPVAIINNQETLHCADQLCQFGNTTAESPVTRNTFLPKQEKYQLPRLDSEGEKQDAFAVKPGSDEVALDRPVTTIDYGRLLSALVQTELAHFKPPQGVDSLQFTVRRVSDEQTEQGFSFQFQPDSPLPSEYQHFVNRLFGDKKAQQILYRLTDKRYSDEGAIPITIPLRPSIKPQPTVL